MAKVKCFDCGKLIGWIGRLDCNKCVECGKWICLECFNTYKGSIKICRTCGFSVCREHKNFKKHMCKENFYWEEKETCGDGKHDR